MSLRRRACAIVALLLLAACQGMPQRASPEEGAADPVAAPVPVIAPAPASEPKPVPERFLPVEPSLPTTGAEVLAQLRERLIEAPCGDSPQVRLWQRRYAGSPQRFAGQIETILPWLALTLAELDRYRLPGEFALLPIAESWYRADARGAGDHVGLWQIGRSTAAYLELPITRHYDGRMDALASTDAALDYLARLHNRFGEWQIAAAAYNAGPQRVARLLERDPEPQESSGTGTPSGLPAGTVDYLARTRALACLLGAPERHGLELPDDTGFDPLVSVTLPPGQSTLALIAADRGIAPQRLASLNPAFRGGFIAPDAPRTLLVPQSLSDRFDGFELPHAPTPALPPEPLAGEYTVRRGDTLGAIAQRHGVRLQTLFQLNGLNARSILRPGQRLRLAH